MQGCFDAAEARTSASIGNENVRAGVGVQSTSERARELTDTGATRCPEGLESEWNLGLVSCKSMTFQRFIISSEAQNRAPHFGGPVTGTTPFPFINRRYYVPGVCPRRLAAALPGPIRPKPSPPERFLVPGFIILYLTGIYDFWYRIKNHSGKLLPYIKGYRKLLYNFFFFF